LKTLKLKHWTYLLITIFIISYVGLRTFKKFNFNSNYIVGQKIDSLNGVFVYYNGGVDNVTNRNVSEDGYNIGLKYQCVEFVKRYYFERFNHKMPDSYGHAKSFFNESLADGELNPSRNLTQYSNPSKYKPEQEDLIIFEGSIFNKFGHVAIISKVSDKEIEIIQQNPGPFGKSREVIKMNNDNEIWSIENERVVGWLRKEN
jgi:hypothetical protein